MNRSRIPEKVLGGVQITILSVMYSVFRRLACWVDEERALKISSVLINFLHAPMKTRRLQNYQKFFGSIDPERDEKIDAEFLSYMTRISTEVVRDSEIDFEKLSSRVEMRGHEHIDAALKLGKGVILLGGHLGNFYTYHLLLSLKGYNLTNISFPIPIPSMERQVNRLRKRFKVTSVFVDKNAARTAVKVFRANGIFSILFDVLIRTEKSVDLPFGASHFRMDLGPALLATHFGVPILPVIINSDRPYHHSIEIQPPLPTPGGETENERALNLLKLWRDWLEKEVTKRPGQWWYWGFMDLHDTPQPNSFK